MRRALLVLASMALGACFPGPLEVDADVAPGDSSDPDGADVAVPGDVEDVAPPDAVTDAADTDVVEPPDTLPDTGADTTSDVPADSASDTEPDIQPDVDEDSDAATDGDATLADGDADPPACVDGTDCDDDDPCTTADTCVAGACIGTERVCAASDQCHVAGVCDPTTGLCSNPAAEDGEPCDDDAHCTATDTCSGGHCQGSGLPDDDAKDWATAVTRTGTTGGMARAPNGDTWLVLLVSTGTSSFGPTAAGGTLDVTVGGDERGALVAVRYDETGHVVAAKKIVAFLASVTPIGMPVHETRTGFVVTMDGLDAAIRFSDGTVVGASTRQRCRLLARFDDDAERRWGASIESDTGCEAKIVSTVGDEVAFVVKSLGSPLVVERVGAPSASSESSGQHIVALDDGSATFFGLPGTPLEQGPIPNDRGGLVTDIGALFWYPFSGTADLGPQSVTARGAVDLVVGEVGLAGDAAFSVGVTASSPAATLAWGRCALVAALRICDFLAEGTVTLYGPSGTLRVLDHVAGSWRGLVAVDEHGTIAWTRQLSASALEVRALVVSPSGLRFFGLVRGALSVDGVVAGFDPGPGRAGDLVLALGHDGVVKWGGLMASGPTGAIELVRYQSASDEHAITFFASAPGAALQVGMATPAVFDDEDAIARVNSAGEQECLQP